MSNRHNNYALQNYTYNNVLYSNSMVTIKNITYPSNPISPIIKLKDFIPILLKIIDKRGTINVGGKSQTIFNFVRKEKKNITKVKSKGKMPKRVDMNLGKLFKIL